MLVEATQNKHDQQNFLTPTNKNKSSMIVHMSKNQYDAAVETKLTQNVLDMTKKIIAKVDKFQFYY